MFPDELLEGDSKGWNKNKKALSKSTKYYKKEAIKFGRSFKNAVDNRLCYILVVTTTDINTNQENDIIIGAFSDRKIASKIYEYFYKKYMTIYNNDKTKFQLNLYKEYFNSLRYIDYDKIIKMFPELKNKINRIDIGSL